MSTKSPAIHLRFDIKHSSLPEIYKQRLLNLADQRISKEGIIVIKAGFAAGQRTVTSHSIDFSNF